MSEDANGPCIQCGITTDKKIEDIWICDDCYIIRGACCTEFEPEDDSE